MFILQNMEKIHTLNHPSRIQDVKFCKTVDGEKDVMLVAAEDKKVTIYEVPADREKAPFVIAELIGHTNRYVVPCKHVDGSVNLTLTG